MKYNYAKTIQLSLYGNEQWRQLTKKGTITFGPLRKDKPSRLTHFCTGFPSLVSGKQDSHLFLKKN